MDFNTSVGFAMTGAGVLMVLLTIGTYGYGVKYGTVEEARQIKESKNWIKGLLCSASFLLVGLVAFFDLV